MLDNISATIQEFKSGLKELVGKNINLVPIEIDDSDLLVEWRNNNLKYFYDQNPSNLENQLKWMGNYFKKLDDMMFIAKSKENTPFGTVALYNIDVKSETAEFGRLLIGDDEFRGKGYSKEIINMVLKFGFKILKLRKIVLSVFDRNDIAKNLYLRVGFQITDKMPIFRHGNIWNYNKDGSEGEQLNIVMSMNSNDWKEVETSI